MMVQGAYTNAVAVVPSDVTTLKATTALYVGVAGDVTVVMATRGLAGVTVKFKAMPVGIHQLSVIQVMSTGTTATDMVALR